MMDCEYLLRAECFVQVRLAEPVLWEMPQHGSWLRDVRVLPESPRLGWSLVHARVL